MGPRCELPASSAQRRSELSWAAERPGERANGRSRRRILSPGARRGFRGLLPRLPGGRCRRLGTRRPGPAGGRPRWRRQLFASSRALLATGGRTGGGFRRGGASRLAPRGRRRRLSRLALGRWLARSARRCGLVRCRRIGITGGRVGSRFRRRFDLCGGCLGRRGLDRLARGRWLGRRLACGRWLGFGRRSGRGGWVGRGPRLGRGRWLGLRRWCGRRLGLGRWQGCRRRCGPNDGHIANPGRAPERAHERPRRLLSILGFLCERLGEHLVHLRG